MTEIIWNQVAATFPIHFFAYIPFLNHLRLGKRITFTIVAALEGFYILLFGFLLHAGISLSLIQFIAIPLFGIPFFLLVKMNPGKIMFLYVFSISYLMALRGTAAFLHLCFRKTTEPVFYSLNSGILCLFLYLLTMPAMLSYFKRTAQMVIETHAPQVWQKVWLLPLFNLITVMLFTFAPDTDSQINAQFMLTRLLLILCMFIVYYFVLHSINQLQKQIAAEERAHYLKQLTDVQAAQYSLLQARIEETRQARHDLRQHLRAMQGYVNNGNITALTSYLKTYGDSIPSDTLHQYCSNYAVDSVLCFYAEKASLAGIQINISFCPLTETVIPEPEFCVLLGNLLENALDACTQQKEIPTSATPVITVRAKKLGSHMLTLTVDNTCPRPPVFCKGHFLSSKHEGFGNGTESVRNIAEKYQGDARFEWKDGMFFASVMLNP